MSSFTPIGPHDQTLLDRVRPDNWSAPDPVDRYDLVVLGGGTGGLVSAAIGVALGARVALVERALLGGDCLNHGCVPSKAILRAASAWAGARDAQSRYHGPAATGEGDFAAVMERMRRLRSEISEVDGAQRFRDLGVDIFFGSGRFIARDALDVDGVRLDFRRCILATGARAALPPIPGLRDADPLTNESIFSLETLPDDLLVLGAGPIGSELSLAFARFGSRVTLVDRADRPLFREEPDASSAALNSLLSAGVNFVGGASITRVTREGGRTRVHLDMGSGEEASISADRLLVALGRSPNLDASFEVAGVETTPSGVVTDNRLRTTNPRIFAVGDIAGRHQFTHVADAHARLATRNALFFGRQSVEDLVVPAATYLEPEIARVGGTASELREDGRAFETIRIDFDHVDRAVLEGTAGFVLVHVAEGGDTILGATIVAENAGDLIAQLSQAMTLDIGLTRLGDVVFPYPTVAEALRKAADARRRERLTPRTKTLFDLFFRIWRRIT